MPSKSTRQAFAPRGLRRASAAHYIGVSASKFDEARKLGLVPSPKIFLGVTLYDRRDLDRLFDDLPEIDTAANNNDEWEIALRHNGVIA
ncbi:XRE family transcriptional regulator [Bradyrhizobium sp. 157]|uniref:XRE family transcriptional regulator n=1 Tax=Bradyrhizobium sp. 157 TaxID=2782631 RepID=UPI001FF9F4A6|nr:XRE family transcriptional regulator [Bradyrhizobium sp. 157]MCK1640453.1 XRE family transcriptional regulator [Bradyrhizobium sp. 157]